MLKVGVAAPAFVLPDQDGAPVSLASLRGSWVVLYFYPRDDTPGCTTEACEFTAALPDFRALAAMVFGCSVDSAASHTRFVAKHGLGIRLLTDADRQVMRAYGAFGKKQLYGKEVVGVLRSTVLIAPDGTVAHHWRSVKAAGHAAAVAARLRELRGDAAARVFRAARKDAKASSDRPAKKATKKVAKRVAKRVAKKTAKKVVRKAAARTGKGRS